MVGGESGGSCPPIWNAPSINIEGCSAHTEQPPTSPDAVAYAAQTGRLDFLSAILAALGLIIVAASAFAYVEFRSRVTKTARKIALEETRELVNELVPPEVRRAIAEWQAEFGDTFRPESGGDSQELQNALGQDGVPDDKTGA